MHFFRSLCASLAIGLCMAPSVGYAENQLSSLGLDEATQLIDTAKGLAVEAKVGVCIAVTDFSGTLISFERMDGAPFGCVEAAIKKARAASLHRMKTSIAMQQANGEKPYILALPEMVAVGGGAPVISNNAVVGAVGVAGAINQIETRIAESVAGGYIAAKPEDKASEEKAPQ